MSCRGFRRRTNRRLCRHQREIEILFERQREMEFLFGGFPGAFGGRGAFSRGGFPFFGDGAFPFFEDGGFFNGCGF